MDRESERQAAAWFPLAFHFESRSRDDRPPPAKQLGKATQDRNLLVFIDFSVTPLLGTEIG